MSFEVGMGHQAAHENTWGPVEGSVLGIEEIQCGEGLLVDVAKEGYSHLAHRSVKKRRDRSREIKEPPTGRGAVAAAALMVDIGRLLGLPSSPRRSRWSSTD